MKIASAQLELSATHVAMQHTSVEERLRTWVGSRRPDFEQRGTPRPPPPPSISAEAKAAQVSDAKAKDDNQKPGDAVLDLIRTMLEYLTGRRIRVFDPGELETEPPASQPPTVQAAAQGEQRAGYGVEYDYRAVHAEMEMTQFSAHGQVLTADGKRIDFSLELSMQRSYYEEESVSIRAGDAQLKDPIVLNFSGNAAQLQNTTFQFDLDSDGLADNMRFVGSGSGFLALDRNRNGKIDDGSELFGPSTGNGFAELAALDSDSNGWIDENDAAWKDLSVWMRDANGKNHLQSLSEASVGALSLAHVATPFALKDTTNATQGQIRSSGVFLHEDGSAGTMQQIDIAV